MHLQRPVEQIIIRNNRRNIGEVWNCPAETNQAVGLTANTLFYFRVIRLVWTAKRGTRSVVMRLIHCSCVTVTTVTPRFSLRRYKRRDISAASSIDAV